MATLTANSTTIGGQQQQSYYLRFSSHSAALSRSLVGLLSESYCTDVHISTGHQSQTIRAHKIILSAFSPYFKSLFSSLPSNQFPVIIIRDISYDILRTIIEFCYRGEILVSRDKLDDIVSAAKFLQIEGAKDFILPKSGANHTQSQHSNTTNSGDVGSGYHYNNNTNNGTTNGSTSRMQIDLQHMRTLSQQHRQALAQAYQRSYQQSLLSKAVHQRPSQQQQFTTSSTSDQPSVTIISGTDPQISNADQISDSDLSGDQRGIKREFIDEELEDEEFADELDEEIQTTGQVVNDVSSGEKSGMFAEFEDQSHVTSNNNNNISESNQHSDDSNAAEDEEEVEDEEHMDTTTASAILAKVPQGTSVSTSILNDSTGAAAADSTATTKSDNNSVPKQDSEEELIIEEEEEYEDEFDEEEDEDLGDVSQQRNPMTMVGVGLQECESHQAMDTPLARAIAASTLASLNSALELDSEVSQSSSSYSSPHQSMTISNVATERRGRGRPPKYDMGNVFTSQLGGNTSAKTQQISSSPSTSTASVIDAQSSAQTRSRRGRPPSMPEDLLRSLTGRLDKAHHKCPHCPQIYYGYHAMRDHITSVHLNSGEKYICNLCNKEYTWRITLRKHLKFHHGVHPDQVSNA
ncbi:longitudinals lacking protein, isoforms H/M/V-like [Oppia nitens]|uniref:longitudinals lacking protein, isoforms H/M/V-like n=1 Tax=Oppia nitens TaxID=1686743 RepID=UPI0023DB0EC5|nr:longitudinals lacking protein, isoforms H/M/V-like [Oppia nitens]